MELEPGPPVGPTHLEADGKGAQVRPSTGPSSRVEKQRMERGRGEEQRCQHVAKLCLHVPTLLTGCRVHHCSVVLSAEFQESK